MRTAAEAWDALRGYARRTRQPGESDVEALARACAERGAWYEETQRQATEPLHPRTAEEAPAALQAQREQLADLRRQASEAGLSLEDWLGTPEGGRAYAEYTENRR